MNIHQNARLTLARRLEMVQDVVARKLTYAAAAAHGVSVPTVRKWVGRFLSCGASGLRDASSRPQASPRAIASKTALAIVELRRRYLTHAAIARALGISASTVGRVLRRAKLARRSDLRPSEPVMRYEHACPGDLVHLDTQKLGRIEKLGHRITRNRRDTTDGAGWEYLFVAVDDHARLAYSQMKANECGASASEFLLGCCALLPQARGDGAPRARSVPRDLRRRVESSGCGTSSPDPTDRKPMARPNGSFSPPCANGPTPYLIGIPWSAPLCSVAGCIITTGIGHTMESAASRLSVAWLSPTTTCWRFTASRRSTRRASTTTLPPSDLAPPHQCYHCASERGTSDPPEER
jgi:transposase-like protein